MSLASEMAKCFDSRQTGFFFKGCIEEQIAINVENSSDVLADRAFSEEDIKFMKNHKLSDLTYDEYPSDSSLFRIRSSDDAEGVLFSDRMPTKGELRGDVLRTRLGGMKNENPETTLYRALTLLVQDPSMIVKYFYPSAFLSDENFQPGGEYADKKQEIIDGLARFVSACILYVEKMREDKVLDENAIRQLKEVFMMRKEDILSLVLDENIGAESLFENLQEKVIEVSAEKKRYGAFFDDSEIADLFVLHEIGIPDKKSTPRMLVKKISGDIRGAFRNVESTNSIIGKLRRYGFSNFDKKKVEAIKNQMYFAKLDPSIREIIREIRPNIHAANPGYLTSLLAWKHSSTTGYVIQNLNKDFKQALRTGNFDIMRKNLLMLGLGNSGTTSAIGRIKASVREEVPELKEGGPGGMTLSS